MKRNWKNNFYKLEKINKDLEFYLSAGDYIIIFAQQVKTGANAQADATIEFWEEI